MLSSSRKLLLVLCSLATGLVLACSSNPSDQPKPDHLDKPPPVPKAGERGTGSEDGEPSDGADAGEVDGTVIEIAGARIEDTSGALANTPISPTPLSVEWTTLSDHPQGISLVPFATGVLARSGDVLLERGKGGQLDAAPDLELPEGELIGDWPADAWAVSDSPSSKIPRLKKFEQGQWRIQKHRHKSQPGADKKLRRSWQKGLLLREDTRLYRVGSKRDTPKLGPRMGKSVRAVAETRSGRLYSLSVRKTSIYAQRDCTTFDCVEANAVKLPYGGGWSFPAQIPRTRHSITMFGVVEHEGIRGFHLLHYGAAGWRLESLVHEPDGMWPAAAGGLWVLVDAELWFRESTKGEWFNVGLPAGGSSWSVAVSPDQTQLWLAGRVDGQGRIWTTPAEARSK